MIFSEANRKFKIFQTSNKKVLAGHVSHFSFVGKKPSTIPL